MKWDGVERRVAVQLSDEQVELIAERAADKALQKAFDQIANQIGRSILSKLAWMAGAVVVALFIWLSGRHG